MRKLLILLTLLSFSCNHLEKKGTDVWEAPVKNTEKVVVVYSTDWCHWCDVAKKFMKKNKINIIEKDYSDPKVKKKLVRFAKSVGFTEDLESVPIFVIGKKIFVGYNQKQILCEIGREKCLNRFFTTWRTPLK